MHEPTPYPLTAQAVYQTQPLNNSGQPEYLPGQLPPGVQVVTLPNGVRTLAYTHDLTPVPLMPAGATVAAPIPVWAKTTALLAPTIGAGIGAAAFGLAYAAPGLIAMSQALWATVALIAAGALAPLLLRLGAKRPAPNITQNITATGLFGRANGTINHR